MTDMVATRFRKHVDYLLALEGGYVNHPHDRGGETKYGISRRAHPELDIASLTRDQAIDIYFDDYWRPLKCDKFESSKVAGLIFTFAVHAGHGAAAKVLQVALNGLGRPLTVDKKIGPATIAAANQVSESRLIPAIEREILHHYQTVVERNPSQGVFLKGWQNRLRRVMELE